MCVCVCVERSGENEANIILTYGVYEGKGVVLCAINFREVKNTTILLYECCSICTEVCECECHCNVHS